MDPEIKIRFDNLEKKLDLILLLLENDVKPNCNKMSSHIDFIDTVYENVKNPLGFICSKVNYLRSDAGNYSLDDKNDLS
tara:strand:- start:573 stop:809 length:237 start_codon:yes stop_codon:yes gene_type:complete